LLDPVFVDEMVAFSPEPEPWELRHAAQVFKLLVVAEEEGEMSYSLEDARALGLRVVHEPVPDFRWPSLQQLFKVAELVSSAAEAGERVLIHCRGGVGRSATYAAGYLVYRYRVSARSAVAYVRTLRPGAVEHPGQEAVLRAMEAVLSLEPPQRSRLLALGDLARLAGMLGEALVHARLLGLHGLGGFLSREARELLQGLREDSWRLASLDVEEAGAGSYVLRAVAVSYSEAMEKALEELAGELGRKHRLLVRSFELSLEYW